MSMPEIPSLEPQITLTRDNAINLNLIAVGLDELSLAHLLNCEAEKAQFALGTLETSPGPVSIEELWEVSKSTRKMLRDVTRSQMILGMRVENLIEAIMEQGKK